MPKSIFGMAFCLLRSFNKDVLVSS